MEVKNEIKSSLENIFSKSPIKTQIINYIVDEFLKKNQNLKPNKSYSFEIDPHSVYSHLHKLYKSYDNSDNKNPLGKYFWLKKPLTSVFRKFTSHMKGISKKLNKSGSTEIKHDGEPLEVVVSLDFNGIREEAVFNLTVHEQDYYKKQQKLSLTKIILSFTLIIAIFTLFILVAIRGNKVPTKLALKNGNLLTTNTDDELLWKRDIDKVVNSIYPNQKIADLYDPSQKKISHWVKAITDINNDGKTEVLFGVCSEKYPKANCTVLCFDSKGNLMWHIRPWEDYSWFSNGDEAGSPRIFLEKLKNDGKKYIIVSTPHHRYEPFQIAVINLEGEKIGEFWNTGHAMDPEFYDYDEDGVKEIFVAATNNLYQSAVFCILEPFELQLTTSPIDEKIEKKLGKLRIGGESPSFDGLSLYVRLSVPDWVRLEAKRRINPEKLVLQEDCIEISAYPQPLKKEDVDFFYRLNWDFSMKSFVASDGYHILHNKAYEKGILKRSTKAPQWKEDMLKAQYWNGEEWVDKPEFVQQS